MPNQPKTPNRNVRIPDSIWGALVALATQRGVSVSDVIREALNAYITQPPRKH